MHLTTKLVIEKNRYTLAKWDSVLWEHALRGGVFDDDQVSPLLFLCGNERTQNGVPFLRSHDVEGFESVFLWNPAPVLQRLSLSV